MTAETAVVLPALVVVLLLCLWAVSLVGHQLRCIDAARTGALALARGEPVDAARAAAEDAAPAGARITLRKVAGSAVVEVQLSAGPPGWFGAGGGGASSAGLEIRSRAVAALEEP